MEMRKFIIEIHSDGTLTCCEYEDPKESIRAANDRAWLAGYKRALDNCKKCVTMLGKSKDTCLSANITYHGAKNVYESLVSYYLEYSRDKN
jgi:hypothetical protein